MTADPGSSLHTDVAAYALGLLEAGDQAAFEEHLDGCPRCQAELAELHGLKELLTGIGPVEPDAGELGAAEPPAASVTDLVRRRALTQRRHTRRQVLLGAAASVALLAAGLGAGRLLAGQPASPGGAIPDGARVGRATGAIGVHGLAILVPKPFGAQVTVNLTHIAGPLECQFFAVSSTGARFMIGTWFLPPKTDFGSPKHPAPLQLEGWTTIKFGDVSQIDVIAKGHVTQVSIPIPAATT